jgi:hypothetical protein
MKNDIKQTHAKIYAVINATVLMISHDNRVTKNVQSNQIHIVTLFRYFANKK